jgi:hypothetical protein
MPKPSMAPAENEASYAVGYKKPPLEHRFKPGNGGRRKSAPPAEDLLPADILYNILHEKRSVVVNGKRQRVPNVALIVRRLIQKAEEGGAGSGRLNALLQELAMACSAGWEDKNGRRKLFIDGQDMGYVP